MNNLLCCFYAKIITFPSCVKIKTSSVQICLCQYASYSVSHFPLDMLPGDCMTRENIIIANGVEHITEWLNKNAYGFQLNWNSYSFHRHQENSCSTCCNSPLLVPVAPASVYVWCLIMYSHIIESGISACLGSDHYICWTTDTKREMFHVLQLLPHAFPSNDSTVATQSTATQHFGPLHHNYGPLNYLFDSLWSLPHHPPNNRYQKIGSSLVGHYLLWIYACVNLSVTFLAADVETECLLSGKNESCEEAYFKWEESHVFLCVCFMQYIST